MGGEMADEKALEKLRAYLRELTPQARALLLNSLERGQLSGAQVPGSNLVLEELRRELRNSDHKESLDQELERIGTPARLFFKPIEPYLVDDTPDHVHRGRVAARGARADLAMDRPRPHAGRDQGLFRGDRAAARGQ